MSSKTYFITPSKKIAIAKIKDLFNKVIIQDISIIEGGYRIDRISQKDFYKHSIESQVGIDGYLKHLISLLNVVETNEQKESKLKNKIKKDLAKQIKK